MILYVTRVLETLLPSNINIYTNNTPDHFLLQKSNFFALNIRVN